jgi:hypothetical protein
VTEGNEKNGRDARGRFTVGNPGGPGGSRRRAFTLRRAAEEAISPEHVEAMMRKAAYMGLQGNLSAMRLVLDRVCGRATEAPVEAEPLGIVIPSLRTAADCNVAIDRLVEGICQGTVDRDVAKLLIDAIQTRLKAIEVNELEERLTEVEKLASTVDASGRRVVRRF